MMRDLTNLLPRDRARSLLQLYFLRLSVVGVAMLTVVALAHGVFLLPTYLFLGNQVAEREASIASLQQSLAGSEEREVSERIASLTSDAAYLKGLGDAPHASAAIAAIVERGHAGVRLTGFSYAPPAGDALAKMTVTGVADSRESLRAYEQMLADQPFIDTTELPISAYAKEREIPFTITLTGSFKP